MPNHAQDYTEAALWAYEMSHRQAWCILDTETTGLGGDAQICQIAVIDPKGETLLDTLVKPTVPIPPDAQRIHGITDEMVADAPRFDQVFLQLLRAVGDRDVVIYNAGYDWTLIRQSLKPYGIPLWLYGAERVVVPGGANRKPVVMTCQTWPNGATVHCAMHWYSQWVGDWNSYYGNYRWQRLPGGDHTALGDCRATLEVIRRMAASCELEAEPEQAVENAGAKLVEMPQVAVSATLPAEREYDDIPF